MARINKFAAQNLNDIYGKKEPKPAPADNGNPAGGRPRSGGSHGGMLVLRPPVKQQPPLPLKDLKIPTAPALKKEAPPPVAVAVALTSAQPPNPPVSSNNPVSTSTINNTENSNNDNNKAEIPEGADSNPVREKPAPLPAPVVPPNVESPKTEQTDAISLRPNRRPEVYNTTAVRTLAENAPEKPEILHSTVQTLTPVLNEPTPPPPVKGTAKEEAPAVDVLKPPSRPEPFRPPHLRGDAAKRLEPVIPAAPAPPREDSNPGRGYDNHHRGGIVQQRGGRRDEEGRFARDPSQQQQRYDRDERGGGYFNRTGNSYSNYSRSAPEGRNYDIEVIRPNSGGSDRYNNNNNRDFGYGGRQGFERQRMSPPAYGPGNPYWVEGQGQGHSNYDSYDHRQDFIRQQDGAYRHNYNNNNHFKSGGTSRDFPYRDSGYGSGRDGGGQHRRDQPYGRNSQFGPGAGQFRDNFSAQTPVNNGRFAGPPREQEGGSFRQYNRTQRDTHSGGGYRYNDPTRAFGGDGYTQRPRSGGYEGASPRPRSGGYGGNAGGGRLVGSSDAMLSRPNFYNGHRSPISQDKVGRQDFGPPGRYQYDAPMSRMNEMQSVDVAYQRPRSGGYGGYTAGRSMASSDNMISRPNNFNGPRLPISQDKMDNEDFSRGTQEQYHLEGSFSTASQVQGLDFVPNKGLDNSMDSFIEFDSYRTRRDNHKAEPNVVEEHQKTGWDSSMEYNMLNLESSEKGGVNEELLVKPDHKLDIEQKFFVEDQRQYYMEEEKRTENARKEIVEPDHLAKGISVQKRQDRGPEQEMREEVAEAVLNREPILEYVDPHTGINETSGLFKEEQSLSNIETGIQDEDKLADRFASSKITASRNPRLFQNDSASNTRSPNYNTGRDLGQPNLYASRSSAMSWRREPNELRNGSQRRFPNQYGDYNNRSQSRESSSSDRYQF